MTHLPSLDAEFGQLRDAHAGYPGVSVSDVRSAARVDVVRTGSPAQAGGLRAGDRVLAVDGNLVPTPGSRSRPSAPDGPDPPSSSPSGATAGASACPSGWLPASLAPLRC
ncbi:PDZ domain-containing protein [Streptomyces sp. TR1341]|uniref:PDZ domain-containing protein n=1 Tax=Streptomyces sp. TR1341 TaxID=2601266 RepID=UPI00192F0C82